MSKRPVHLICNAHLDPVWLWEWQEGAAEALSTFRTAADLCEEFDTFVFNHNEAILYRWVEEYEPALFRRIQRLVKEGRWHIIGGWHLQPDCNMPSGESFVRQILYGTRYFKEKFGVRPTTAINFDPFGHTRGLVQILVRSGYDSYLFCRPGQNDCPLPGNTFRWIGFDGSEVLATRTPGYNSPLGKARGKAEAVLSQQADANPLVILWGVGNHGGGPSRQDIADLNELISTAEDVEIAHSTPEAYFADVAARRSELPVHAADLNPWAVGCYTSQIRIKQTHRRLENELLLVEKMASAASAQGLMPYPQAEIDAALYDLLTAEFHDILPGSSIQPVEEMSLRVMNHGLECLSRAKGRAFFALASGQPKAAAGEIPVLVYNPHPFAVDAVVECEFQLADQNWDDNFTQPVVHADGSPLPCQTEKELSNLNLDWRKRVVFRALLAPSQMNRFDCKLQTLPAKPRPELTAADGGIEFRTNDLEVVINTETGLIDRCRIAGKDALQPGALRPLVIQDDPDPWGMRVRRFDKLEGAFELMSAEDGSRFSGLQETVPSVRVIEDGAVRTVIEAVFAYDHSAICQRYKLPKRGTEVEVETRVFWNEKDRMLKLAVPAALDGVVEYRGQVAYGVQELPDNGDEAVAQKWTAVVARESDWAVTCINDGIYGSSYDAGEMRLTLLRSPGYSTHPIHDRPLLPADRFTPRIDQGERLFRFWLNTGPVAERLAAIDREAIAHAEAPFALSFFPSGMGEPVKPLLCLRDDSDPKVRVVQVPALKLAEDGGALIVRLFEPTGEPRQTVLSFPVTGQEITVDLGAFEVKTLRIDLGRGSCAEVNLLEEPLGE